MGRDIEAFYQPKAKNASYYATSIQHFIGAELKMLGLDLKKTFAICSYVPDSEARKTFQNCLVYYPS